MAKLCRVLDLRPGVLFFNPSPCYSLGLQWNSLMTLQVTHTFPFCLVKSRLVLFSPGFRQRRGIYSFKEESQEKSFSSGISCRWTSETVIWFKALNHCCVFRSLLIFLFPSIPTDLSHLDSQPDTPMSVESANSEASKLRLKIKVSVVTSPLNLLARGSLPKFCCSKLTFFFWFRLEVKKAAQKVEVRFE